MSESANQVQVMARVLEDLARQLKQMCDDDVDGIMTKRLRLELTVIPFKRPARQNERSNAGDELYRRVIKELREAHTCEQGASLLSRELSTKADYIRVSKLLDLPVSKNSTVDQIKDLIVDRTIGYRTRAAAIRGGGREADEAAQQTPEGAGAQAKLFPIDKP